MRIFEYTPHIYQKGDWNAHIGIFIALQLVPLMLTAIFAYFTEGTETAAFYGFISPLPSIYYWIWSAANVGVLFLAMHDNKRV